MKGGTGLKHEPVPLAIVGGGVVSAVLGVAQSSFGPVGIVATLGVCVAYLFGLGLFASARKASCL